MGRDDPWGKAPHSLGIPGFSQYCDPEEAPGDDDYDDYSKELSQYRRSKERGRGESSVATRATSMASEHSQWDQ
ncbi:hypothetical protein WISP_00789 [Willisornis vidua]|uniref:Uncharacterized protein n=1 Tax=Willisornis vidua TaxID=1566151 RepID=A0ABQ9DY68_9PASS|nr:hypothetical protein WISP_00789 [Willisornis vidua]